MDQKELVKQIISRNQKAKSDRSNWETLWDQAGQFVNAQAGSMLSGGTRKDGEKRGIKVFDGTPENAKDIWVAGMYSGLCPDNYKYLKSIVRPKELMKDPSVRRWLAEYDDIRYTIRNSSNHGAVTMCAFEHQASYGTSIKWAEHDDDSLVRWELLSLTECVFFEGKSGKVDTIFREVPMSIRNILKRWKIDSWDASLRDEIRRKDEQGHKDDLYTFLHAVFPREDYDPWKRDKFNMPWASLWIYPGKQNAVVDEGGYRDFPATVTRVYRQGRELYGRGPAIKAMSDMGVLNEMASTNLRAGHLMVEPPLQVPDDGYTKAIDFTPGATNFYTPSKGELKPITTGLNVPFGLELQDRQEKAVQRWFHVDVFLALTANIDKTKTATEAMEIKQEKLVLLGPMVGAQKSEHLDKDADREFTILYDNGVIPRPPDILLQYMERLDPEYTSPLFLAQRRHDAEAVMTVIQQASMVAQATQDLTILDNIDKDAAYSILADRAQAPEELTMDPAVRDRNRKARQQQAAMMQQAQTGMAAVEAAKNLGQVSTGEDSPNLMADLIKGQMGGTQ